MSDAILPGHDRVADLRPGRTALLRNRATGALVVVRRLEVDERRARARVRALAMPAAPSVAFARAEGALHAVRPHAPGRPLAEVLREGLDVERAIALLGDVAAALAALHARRAAHGAVHPGNVLLREGGGVVLTDGLEPLGPLAEGEGSGFAAPEVVRGAGPSRAADVFALGVLAHLLLARRHPFEAGDAVERARRVLFAVPLRLGVLRPEVPAALCDAVDAALAKEGRRRPRAEAIAAACAAATAMATARATANPTAPFASPSTPPPAAPPLGAGYEPPPSERSRGAATPTPTPTATPPRRNLPRLPDLLAAASRLRARLPDLRAVPARLRSAPPLARAGLVALPLALTTFLAFPHEPAFAREVAARLDAGDLAGARAILDAAAREHRGDARVDKLRGDLACAQRDGAECLRRYRVALAARPSLGGDRRLRENVLRLLAADVDRGALVQVVARLDGIGDALLRASREERRVVRWNAVRALEARGEAEWIDYADLYARDLGGDASCGAKRAAAARLAELRDPRVLARLEEARRRNGGLGGWFCVGDSIDRAIAATRAAAGD